MARRTFYVIDIMEILVHWYAGRSQHELADSLGVDRKTVRRYTAPAIADGMSRGLNRKIRFKEAHTPLWLQIWLRIK